MIWQPRGDGMMSGSGRLKFVQLCARFVICPRMESTWCCDPGKTVMTCVSIAVARRAEKSCQQKQKHDSKDVNSA
uniref:Uncharacterized protein n=1 Tax=Trichuris muris TaxID=70415 RepID=A0A5S6QIW0_TRIMR